MRSDNLQLPCVQLPTYSYNFQLPHGAIVMVVMVVVVNMVVMVDRTGQDRKGQDKMENGMDE